MPLWVAVSTLDCPALAVRRFLASCMANVKGTFVALKVAASLIGLVLLAYAILTLTLLTGEMIRAQELQLGPKYRATRSAHPSLFIRLEATEYEKAHKILLFSCSDSETLSSTAR